MVTPAQASVNVRTATAHLARQLGFYSNTGAGFSYSSLTPDQQITLTNTLADYIRARPDLFDTGAAGMENPYVSAAYAKNVNTAPSMSFGDAAGEFLDSVAGNARAINPFDPQNIATTGKWVLAATVAVVIAWLWIQTPPRGPSASRV